MLILKINKTLSRQRFPSISTPAKNKNKKTPAAKRQWPLLTLGKKDGGMRGGTVKIAQDSAQTVANWRYPTCNFLVLEITTADCWLPYNQSQRERQELSNGRVVHGVYKVCDTRFISVTKNPWLYVSRNNVCRFSNSLSLQYFVCHQRAHVYFSLCRVVEALYLCSSNSLATRKELRSQYSWWVINFTYKLLLCLSTIHLNLW